MKSDENYGQNYCLHPNQDACGKSAKVRVEWTLKKSTDEMCHVEIKADFLESKGKAKALRELGWTEELPAEPASPTSSRPPKHAGPSPASPWLLSASQPCQTIKGSPWSSSSWFPGQGFSSTGTAARSPAGARECPHSGNALAWGLTPNAWDS